MITRINVNKCFAFQEIDNEMIDTHFDENNMQRAVLQFQECNKNPE